MNKNNKIKKSTYEKEFRIETKNGKTIEILTYDYTTHYNQNGKILEEIYKYWSDDQSEWFIDLTSYTYNKEGKIAEMYEEHEDPQYPLVDNYKTIYSYDDDGKLVEQAHYDKKGSLKRKYLHQYDEQGRLIKMTPYKSTIDGKLESDIGREMTIEYDEKNHIIKEYHMASYKTSKYNEKGNLLLEEIFFSINCKNIYEYEFDEHGEVIVKCDNSFDCGILKETEITKYDNGNIIEFITQKYDKNGKETENTKRVYTNDEYGNIIKSTYYINGELTSIIRTEIEYYD